VKQEVNFAIREMCELRALGVLLDYCTEVGVDVSWNIYLFPVNTDLLLFQPDKLLKKYKKIKIVNPAASAIKNGSTISGFKAHIAHEKDCDINSIIDLYEITACKYYEKKNKTMNLPRPNIVVGSVKIKSPVEDFQVEIWEKLSKLPYHVVVVPRHPFPKEELTKVNIPPAIKFRNTMGELEDLYAQANLTIMGKLFGVTRYDYNTRDHNPLEATISSNTICGMYSDIPKPYLEFYEHSGLTHRFYDWRDIFGHIDDLINDPLLPEKLKKRKEWIESNRRKYLPRALEVLDIK